MYIVFSCWYTSKTVHQIITTLNLSQHYRLLHPDHSSCSTIFHMTCFTLKSLLKLSLITQCSPTTSLGSMTPLLAVFTQRLQITKIPVTLLTHPGSPLHPSAHPRRLKEKGLHCSRDPHISWSYMEPAGKLYHSLPLLVKRQTAQGLSAALATAPMEKTL